MRYTPKGAAVAQFAVAASRKYKTESGEEREDVLFIDVTAWGRQAEIMGQYFKKGSAIFIEGRLKLDQWEDRDTGQKRSKIGLVMEQFQFVGPKKDGEHDAAEPPPRRPRPASTTAASGTVAEQGEAGEPDDVPF